ncbi:TATA box-binding protein-like 1 [Uloborus diversus]|uniref:TATA box-binding protein-like 1 n=1 Tax=Uloborus diversus TaxID=327109 RepID=UPI002409F87E|nr:TATA box-binding protein-like 1 [Uloborus diversus]
MTTFEGGNGIAYNNRYIEMCPDPQTLSVVNNNVTNSAVSKYEGDHASEQIAVEGDSNEDVPVVDIVINNVVCSFNVRCHLNLRQIALNGANVEYRRENGMVTMKIRKPYTTASIWSSGKITCTGATSDDDAKKASRKFARILQQLGFRVRFTNYRVVNVLGTCTMTFGINLNKFAEKHRRLASYEPELHPGATYKIKELKATLKIFTTGSITITAPCIQNVQLAVEHIFPLVYEFKTQKPPSKNGLPTPLAAARPPLPRDKKIEPIVAEIELSDDDDISDLQDMADSDSSWD